MVGRTTNNQVAESEHDVVSEDMASEDKYTVATRKVEVDPVVQSKPEESSSGEIVDDAEPGSDDADEVSDRPVAVRNNT